MMDWFEKSTIPEGRSGEWAVERFTVSEEDAKFGALRAAMSSSRGRYVPPGTYTRLRRGGVTVMSDTPDEMRDHFDPVRIAHSSVLINGLGLGMVAQAVLRRHDITDVTVIEKSPDVIALVAPHIANPRLTVIEADAFDWKPPKDKRYSVVWHDIWDYICGDNAAEMTTLKRRYGRRADWQGCWCEWQTRRAA